MDGLILIYTNRLSKCGEEDLRRCYVISICSRYILIREYCTDIKSLLANI
jgi:hypothetical protein